MAQQTEHRSFGSPDEVRDFPNGKAEILKIGETEIGRLVFRPGWRWSDDVKPIMGTDSSPPRTSSTTSRGDSRSAWTPAPGSWPPRETSPRC